MAQYHIANHKVNGPLVPEKIIVVYIPRTGTDNPVGEEGAEMLYYIDLLCSGHLLYFPHKMIVFTVSTT